MLSNINFAVSQCLEFHALSDFWHKQLIEALSELDLLRANEGGRMQELVDDIKRLRRISGAEWFAVDRDDAVKTINTLVDLVGEMHEAMSTCKLFAGCEREYDEQLIDDARGKSSPIAELARGSHE